MSGRALEIDVVLTCTDREAYIPHALEVIRSYRQVEATPILCYNGDRAIEADVRLGREPLHLGDYQLAIAGYRRCQHLRILKLSIDTWLVDEAAIIRVFAAMEATRTPYAGNFWDEGRTSLATDMIFADLRWGNVFEHWRYDPSRGIEETLSGSVAVVGRGFLEIHDRRPVHPANRHECSALGMVGHHDLAHNLARRDEIVSALGRARDDRVPA